MIPKAYITEWRQHVAWASDAQIEQDLLISRVLVEIFSRPLIKERLLFRGGTALYKLFFVPGARYSEDIDLVQKDAGPIGPLLSAIRSACDPLLGSPRIRRKADGVSLGYITESEIPPVLPLRLKIEINTREHFAVFPLIQKIFDLRSRWFSGRASIPTYSLEELLATKFRALYQRRKGRDLFDLWYAFTKAEINLALVVRAFHQYMERQSGRITSRQFYRNLEAKISNPGFRSDTTMLLRPEIAYDPAEAFRYIEENILPSFDMDAV